MDNELLFENPVAYHCDTVDEMDFSVVPSLAEIIRNQKSIVFRETDIVEDSKWPTTKNYKLFYKPNNWHYGMRLVLAMDKKVCYIYTMEYTQP